MNFLFLKKSSKFVLYYENCKHIGSLTLLSLMGTQKIYNILPIVLFSAINENLYKNKHHLRNGGKLEQAKT